MGSVSLINARGAAGCASLSSLPNLLREEFITIRLFFEIPLPHRVISNEKGRILFRETFSKVTSDEDLNDPFYLTFMLHLSAALVSVVVGSSLNAGLSISRSCSNSRHSCLFQST